MATLEQKEPIFWLLQFPDRLVLVSDEPTTTGCYALCPDGSINQVVAYDSDIEDYFGFISGAKCFTAGDDYSKVIAGHGSLPSVDASVIAETIGWVDVEALVNELYPAPKDLTEEQTKSHVLCDQWATAHFESAQKRYQYKAGFHKAQELNKNKFTEEDMLAVANFTGASVAEFSVVPFETRLKSAIGDILRAKQQPKQWRVEVDEEQYLTEGWVPSYNNPDNANLDVSAELDYRPRITNNTIKVTKVIE